MMVISANSLLVWFVWGFFMSLGWALGTWLIGVATSYAPPRRGPY